MASLEGGPLPPMDPHSQTRSQPPSCLPPQLSAQATAQLLCKRSCDTGSRPPPWSLMAQVLPTHQNIPEEKPQTLLTRWKEPQEADLDFGLEEREQLARTVAGGQGGLGHRDNLLLRQQGRVQRPGGARSSPQGGSQAHSSSGSCGPASASGSVWQHSSASGS